MPQIMRKPGQDSSAEEFMYKILIVDDEKMIRMGMSKGLPWAQLNITGVYQAGSAMEALEIIGEKQPDIMITDINMPGMTGLELIQRANELKEDIRIIVLTGYDRFDYARECIRMHVADLFLKPIDEEVLTEAIKKQVEFLDRKRKNLILENTMRRVQGNTEQMRLERLLRSLVHRREVDEEELEWMCREYSLPENQELQLAILLPQQSGKNNDREDHYWVMSIKEICIGLVDGQRQGMTFLDDEGTEKILIAFFNHGYVNEIYEKIQELISIMKDEFIAVPKIVLGSSVKGFSNLYISYNDAVYLANRKQGEAQDVLQSGHTGKRSMLFREIYEEFKTSMCSNVGNSDYVLRVFDAFTQAVVSYNVTETAVRRYCFDLANSVCFAYISSTAGTLQQGRLEELMKHLMNVDGMNACEITRDFLVNLFGEETEVINDLIPKVRRYVDDHLEEDLSVSSIAAKFYITPNYLSKLFKKVTGEGCNEYIVRKRIETAQRLLETTNLKTGKIAALVGYRDTNYFSVAFKKYTGYSPTVFRRRLRTGNAAEEEEESENGIDN